MEDDRTDLLDALVIMTGDRYSGVGARFMPGGNKYASGFSIEFVNIEAESSSYAAEEWNEMFAEAFVQSLGGPQSDIVDHVMDMLRRTMGK